jgi:hydroxymethylpyrimidine kinase/phosphomethylpyrimidine kinase
MTPPVVLTVAGSDSGGGAGIQADLKVFAALRCYGASVLTAVTAQNTQGVQEMLPLPSAIVGAQLDSVLDDLPVAAVKVGMVASAEAAGAVAARARAGRLPQLVLDPVLTATTGRRLGVVAAIERLLPHAIVVTPNVDEAAALVGWPITTPTDMAGAAAQLASAGPAYIVITGGDLPDPREAVDVVWTDGGARFLKGRRVPTRNTHGSGCTFSAAIAAQLAHGIAVPDAVSFAKSYVSRALAGAAQWRLGAGSGPLDHFEWTTSEELGT